jgi:GNAT superfamily N-acetyltransferase
VSLTQVKLTDDFAEPPESAVTVRRLPQHVRPSIRWTNHAELRIATLKRGDTDAVLAMLGRCSAATLCNRFHVITDGAAYARQVLADTLGLDAEGAPSADRCVGLATLAVGGDGSAHLGVLVEDGWQRQDAESALMAALAARARERRLPSLVADVLAHNQFIVRPPARCGPITTSVADGSYTVRMSREPEHDGRGPDTGSPVGQEGKHANP